MSNLIRELEQAQKRDDLPPFAVGDTIRVHYRIVEGRTERIQAYEGICIGTRGRGLTRTCMVRKISYGVGVERVFPMHSPRSRALRWCAGAVCAARSSTTCATGSARRPRSRNWSAASAERAARMPGGKGITSGAKLTILLARIRFVSIRPRACGRVRLPAGPPREV